MNDDYESVADEILAPHTKAAKLRATQVWNEFCNSKIPVLLNDIIQKMGINIRGANLTSVDGMTRMDADGVCCIIYDNSISAERKRFTVAHEIGHIALEHTSVWGDCKQFSEKSRESEANAFASELLVPSKDIRQFLRNGGTIQGVMDRYWISKPAAFVAVQKNGLLKKIKA